MLYLQVDEPPPEKKPKLDNDVIASAPTLSAHKEVGGARAEVGGATLLAEDEDGIPAIKSSHLDLDDIPMELLPTHQEKIMKQVCIIIRPSLCTVTVEPL